MVVVKCPIIVISSMFNVRRVVLPICLDLCCATHVVYWCLSFHVHKRDVLCVYWSVNRYGWLVRPSRLLYCSHMC